MTTAHKIQLDNILFVRERNKNSDNYDEKLDKKLLETYESIIKEICQGVDYE